MLEVLSQISTWIAAAVGFLAGVGATLAVVTVGKKGNYADQSGSKVRGDQVGRDKGR